MFFNCSYPRKCTFCYVISRYHNWIINQKISKYYRNFLNQWIYLSTFQASSKPASYLRRSVALHSYTFHKRIAYVWINWPSGDRECKLFTRTTMTRMTTFTTMKIWIHQSRQIWWEKHTFLQILYNKNNLFIFSSHDTASEHKNCDD